MDRKPFFDYVRALLKRGYTDDEVRSLDDIFDAATAGDDCRVAPLPAPPAPPPFNRDAFLARFVNLNAAAIAPADIAAAASRLGVPAGHIRMVMKVEGRGVSFDNSGRPIILPEPHIFHRQTDGAHSVTSFSYPVWGTARYPRSYDARWQMLADMAERDEAAALESASWGMFQVMGFNWESMGYTSVHAFVDSIVASEAGHLDSVVRYIEANRLQRALRACRAGSPKSCRAFAKGYNGPGYARNAYHIKMAAAL